jgi:hypothetical protein
MTIGKETSIHAHRGKSVSLSEFRRMWNDKEMTQRDIARELGITIRSVHNRARARGLPSRHINRRCGLDAEARAMWDAGVTAKDIAAEYGLGVPTVYQYFRKLRGGSGRRAQRKTISIEDYRALQLAKAMAQSANETKAEMRKRNMEDRINSIRAS